MTPVYRPPRRALRAMLASVRNQSFGDWEHCLVDDRSEQRAVRSLLDAAAADARVHVRYREQQGGIVAATNDALEMASGEFIAFLDNDDELAPQALELVAGAISAHPDADYLYSDQDKISFWGRHLDPFIKPAWSPDRLLGQMYIAHFRVIRRSLIEELGGLREGIDGAQDWDLALRIAERSERMVHVPGLLYHWRTLKTSTAGPSDPKPWAHQASHRVVTEHVERRGIQATVEAVPDYPGHYWLRPALTDHPRVSIVIPTAGTHRDMDREPLVVNCVRSIVERSAYDNYELVVVIDADAPQGVSDQLHEIAGDRLQLVPFDQAFNFSAKVNLGAEMSSGEQILLLNDDIEVPAAGWRPDPKRMRWLPEWDTTVQAGRRIWIESMLAYALQPGVGAVGAKLHLPDGRIQHGGVIARGRLVGHAYYLHPGDTPGYTGNLIVAGNFLAVTAACLMTPRSAFEAVDGMDTSLPLNYNDVDYCLRLRAAGLRSVMVPQVELLHLESASRGRKNPAETEIEALQGRWGTLLENDPYYAHAFTDGSFTLPYLNRKGKFQPQALRAYLLRLKTLYRDGGIRLVGKRALVKSRRILRRTAPDGAAGP